MPRVHIALTVRTVPTALTAPIAPIATTATTATTAFTPPRGSTLLVRVPKGQSRKGVQSRQFNSSSVPISSSHSVKSDGRRQAVQVNLSKSHSGSQAVEVYSFGHSVDSVDSIQSKSDLINRYVYHNTRAFIYQIGSQNLSKIKAILILSYVTKVCDYTKLLENI